MAGGGGARVVRVGTTVRRQVGPWTPAVHALLRYLADVGFEGAPRVHGFDDQGREVLSFVEGVEGHHARLAALHSDRALAGVARLVRRLHDAVDGFVPPADARWRFLAGAAREGIVCHNDLAPVNTIYLDGRVTAFIDWDYAAPAPPLWELACAVWAFVPLADDEFCRRYSYPPVPRGPRLRLFCDSYGLDGSDRAGLLDVVRARQVASYRTLRLGAEAGDPWYARVWAETRGQRYLDAIGYLDEQRDHWQRHLG